MSQVTLDPELYSRIEDFAKVAGISPRQAVNDAVNEWLEITGEPMQDEILRRRSKKVSTRKKKVENKSSIRAMKSGTILSIDESPSFTGRKRKAVVAVLATGTGQVVSQSA